MKLSLSKFHLNINFISVSRIFDPLNHQLHQSVALLYVNGGGPGGFELINQLQPFSVSEG